MGQTGLLFEYEMWPFRDAGYGIPKQHHRGISRAHHHLPRNVANVKLVELVTVSQHQYIDMRLGIEILPQNQQKRASGPFEILDGAACDTGRRARI
jgi:hypothetical protein